MKLNHLALAGATALALATTPAHSQVISGGDFQLYKPGSTSVTAELVGGYVSWGGVIPPTNLTVIGGSANYSDSTTGPTVDLLGWSKIQGNADLLYNGPGGSMALNCFAAWGGDTRVETTGSLHTITDDETITISVAVSGGGGPMTGPLAFHLYANGSLVTPSSSVNVSGTANQTISRTYGKTALVDHIGATTKIVLGVEDANNEGGRVIFDNVSLVTSVPDTTAPSLTSFEHNKGSGPVVPNEPVTYTVTFSEPMYAPTVDAADFANTYATAMTVNSVTSTTDPAVFTVVVTPTATGTLQLKVAAGATLTDLEGNALDPALAPPDDSPLTVTDDPVAPTLTSIDDNVAGGPILGGLSVTYTVTFNEGMNASTVGTGDFDNAGSPAATINSVTPTGNPAVFTVSVTSAVGTGTLQLRIKADAVLTDIAGNALVVPVLDETIINTTPPPTYRWQGATGGDWSVVGNWNNSVPGATHTAILSDSAGAGQTLNLDTDVTIAGLTFNNQVANQIIASTSGKSLTLASGGKVTVDAGSHTISTNVNALATAADKRLTKSGPGALTLSGTDNSIAGAFHVDGGTLTVASSATLAVVGERFLANNGSTMVVSGTLNLRDWSTVGVAEGFPGAPESTMILKDSAKVNTPNSFFIVGDGGVNDGRLTIQDSAELNASMLILGQYGGGTKGYVIQNSGAVNLTLSTPGSLWYPIPALQIGSAAFINFNPGANGNGQGEYHLNGGTLTAHSIGGGGGAHGGSSKFYFNGGTLKPTVSDAAVATALAGMAGKGEPAQTVFMQYLTQVVVNQNGAIIDTADGLSISIAQSLVSGTGTGGLTKQGLGTLTLLQASSYTGPTLVQSGTLACATAASVAPTALEIDAAAKLDLQYAGNQTVPSLKVGAAVMALGVYGSSSSPAPLANQDDVHFSGTGTVTVAAGYAAWANTYAPGQTPGQDHDSDGVENGLEYFMGQTGSSFTAMPGLDGANKVTWTKNPTYFGTWQVQTSADLGTWINVVGTDNGTSVSYTLTPDLGKQFVRLLVTPTL
jgi:autotransporter-associated beta strand protein